MKDTPEDWPRIAPAIFYEDAAEAIEWLGRAFGFETRLRIDGEGGRVEHSELVFGDGLIMVASAAVGANRPVPLPCASPRSVGGANTQFLCVSVDDVDSHCERARTAGARIVEAPATQDYGEEYGSSRTYRAEDPEGHTWTFLQRVRDPRPGAR